MIGKITKELVGKVVELNTGKKTQIVEVMSPDYAHDGQRAIHRSQVVKVEDLRDTDEKWMQ